MKTEVIVTPLWNQVNFNPDIIVKLTSTPRHENALNSDANNKNKSFSIPTRKPNRFGSTALKWWHFGYPHNNQIQFILHSNQVKFRAPHRNQGNSDAHTKTRRFAPCVKKQVNFDHLRNNQIVFIPTQTTCKRRCLHWNQVNLEHPHKIQFNFMLILKPSDIRLSYN